MKAISLFNSIVLTLLLISCGQSTPEVEESDERTEVDTTKRDSIPYLPDTIVPDTIVYNGLRDFFTPATCDRVRQLNDKFNTYSRNEEFDQILDSAQSLLRVMRSEVYEYETKYKNDMPKEYGQPETNALFNRLSDYSDSLAPISVDYGGEGVSIAFFIDFEIMKSTARQTPSEADDQLIKILRRSYGRSADFDWLENNGWKGWWSMDQFTYEFGNQYLAQTFTLIKEFEATFPDQFVDRVTNVKQKLVDELQISDGGMTTFSKELILDEFESIYYMEVLNEAQKSQLEQEIEHIKTSDQIQFETAPY